MKQCIVFHFGQVHNTASGGKGVGLAIVLVALLLPVSIGFPPCISKVSLNCGKYRIKGIFKSLTYKVFSMVQIVSSLCH